MKVALSRPGLIVVDSTLTIVALNVEAVQILTYPEPPDRIEHIDSWLANKIRVSLLDRQSPMRVVGEFHSARRTYRCRSFPVDLPAKKHPGNHTNGPVLCEGMAILMIERVSNGATMIAEVVERYGLTARERETVEFLLEGLTSKEIAVRMKISPNTVKAFIRLVMVKMGVSTRSGIIGKLAGPSASFEQANDLDLLAG